MVYMVKYINEIGENNAVESIVKFRVTSYQELIRKEQEFRRENPWFECPRSIPELVDDNAIDV